MRSVLVSPLYIRIRVVAQVVLACGEAHRDNVGVAGGRVLPVMYAGLSAELKPGDPVLLNDGTVRMVVVESAGVASSNVLCRVVEPGMVSSRKGVNVPGTLVELPSIGPKVGEECGSARQLTPLFNPYACQQCVTHQRAFLSMQVSPGRKSHFHLNVICPLFTMRMAQ